MKKFLIMFKSSYSLDGYYTIMSGESIDDLKLRNKIIKFLFKLEEGDYKFALASMDEEKERMIACSKNFKIFEIVGEVKSDNIFEEAVNLAKKENDEDFKKRSEQDKKYRKELYESLKQEFEN